MRTSSSAAAESYLFLLGIPVTGDASGSAPRLDPWPTPEERLIGQGPRVP